MSKPKFFHLGSGTSTATLAEWAHDEMDLELVTCPANDGHQRAGKRLTDLSVTLPGHSTEDIVWTWYSECLVTDPVLELLEASGFTGFEVKPVKAAFKRSVVKPPRLWELVVTGWGGLAPPPESGIKLIEDCPACGHKVYSAWTKPEKLIAPPQWDGSDFFMVWPLPRHVFITERVACVFRDKDLSGGIVSPSRHLAFSSKVVPTLSPGRLSYYMPDERARELGESMGIY